MADSGGEFEDDDDSSESADVKAEIEAARENFTANRHKQRHAGDRILRILAKHFPFNEPLTDGDSAGGKTKTHVDSCIRDGIKYFSTLQMKDGHWPGDYGGPMFLLPGLVIACYVTKTDLGPQRRFEMLRYLRNMQNKDGGWGLHIEGESTMKGTALNYIAMRLLGATADEEAATAARRWIQEHGSALYAPSWAKLWMCVLGVYEYEGLNPLTPETWILPYWVPMHPGRYWCHCRIVYLPQAYLYGIRARGELTKLVKDLRTEIYSKPYDKIQWADYKGQCCKIDEYFERPKIQRFFWDALYFYEHTLNFPGKERLRKAALKEIIELIKHEDVNTKWICIGPVNKVLNMVATWFHDPGSDHFKNHVPRLLDYLWLAEDGMKMQGYNGSQLWDTAFAAQAICATGMAEEFKSVLRRTHHYFDIAQVREDTPGGMRYYRHISKGAWPFSTRDHGWPISDCSSEGMKGTMDIQNLPFKCYENEVSEERLADCVNVSLSFQNPTGGWATYELRRGGAWLELLNPSEVFSDIMVDYDYVECTSSSVQALSAFRKKFPDHRRQEVDRAIKRGADRIIELQRPDGSWYGSWGVCFTYGCWFGVAGLVSVGLTVDSSPELAKACEYLLSKQRDDGGLGESYLSCVDCEWRDSEHSQIVNTAWALLSLCLAGYHDQSPMEKMAQFLMRSQQGNGDWPQQLISGVFNKTCMITYANYRCIFPIWALGSYRMRILSGYYDVQASA
eukprot:CAMPEP_0198733352 /NCGR_PEP_ID=MMETSP1475-20131203/45031_1 /TAXON_ID= ORGANISM="Unidentified sp., Strain CCMP1999" /NCGR_SAMPLE_ID=MMETSP1475 /ASSEMBLY_ACC=CAM_ASM_001111 /LENGTH=733 /DNA_ID=CAMNT_0044496637 /DNA_START=86 /DNA_END=2286 /DNA_ORIENTATION=+